MKRVVFISHSSADRAIAEQICSFLEGHGLPCWVAPRDVTPGKNYGAAILDAIDECSVFLLILSSESNKSGQVVREVERAASSNSTIIPFRVEDVQPSRNLEFYVSTTHWLDATTRPLDKHLRELLKAVQNWQTTDAAPEQRPPPVALPTPSFSSLPPSPPFGSKLLIGIVAVLVLCLVPGYFLLRHESVSRPVTSAPAIPAATVTPAPVESPSPAPSPTSPIATPPTPMPNVTASPPAIAATSAPAPPIPVHRRLGELLRPTASLSAPSAPVKSVPIVREVAASSELHFHGEVRKASQVFDGKPETGWVSEGDGIGQSLTVHFKVPAIISSISILAATGTDPGFRIRNRLHTLRVTFGDGANQVLTLEDQPNMQRFELAHPVTTKWIRFHILSVYPGNKLKHTPIFEIAFNRDPK